MNAKACVFSIAYVITGISSVDVMCWLEYSPGRFVPQCKMNYRTNLYD